MEASGFFVDRRMGSRWNCIINNLWGLDVDTESDTEWGAFGGPMLKKTLKNRVFFNR